MELMVAGFDASALKAAGFDATALMVAGFSVQQLKDAEFSEQQLIKAGFTLQQLKEVGFSAQQLKEVGFTLEQLKNVGFRAQQLKEAGFSASDLKGAGFDLIDLIREKIIEEKDLNDEDYRNIKNLWDNRLYNGRDVYRELEEIGYIERIHIFKDAGFTVYDFIESGEYTDNIIIDGSFELTDLVGAVERDILTHYYKEDELKLFFKDEE
jgi:intracellular multiplication protein IcmE